MSTKRGWFAILDARTLDVPAIVARAARRAPHRARADELFVVTGPVASIAIVGDGYGHVDQWAQAVSLEARRRTIAFFTLEGQWGYLVCEAGAEVGGMAGYPYAVPQLFGDVDRAATLLTTTRAALEGYCSSDDEDDQFVLARSFGARDPFTPASRRVAAPPVTARATWMGLAKPLPRPKQRRPRGAPEDRVRPGWNNRHRFPIVIRIAGAKTILEIPGTPAFRASDADADRALRRLEASVLDRVAAQVAADRFPFDTIEFVYGASRDGKRRDLIAFGRAIDWRRVPTGRLEFAGLTANRLAALIQGGFVDPDAPDEDGVRSCDWSRALEAVPGVTARGAAFAPSRLDYRTEITGLEGPRAGAAMRIAHRAARAAPPVAPAVGVEVVARAQPAAQAAALRALARELRGGATPVDYVRIRSED